VGRVVIADAGQLDVAILLGQLAIHAGVIAPESAYADDRDPGLGCGSQAYPQGLKPPKLSAPGLQG
jgi:hypothetical protein